MSTVTISSDFHPTTIRVRTGWMSRRTYLRVQRALCGCEDCTCGGMWRGGVEEDGWGIAEGHDQNGDAIACVRRVSAEEL